MEAPWDIKSLKLWPKKTIQKVQEMQRINGRKILRTDKTTEKNVEKKLRRREGKEQ